MIWMCVVRIYFCFLGGFNGGSRPQDTAWANGNESKTKRGSRDEIEGVDLSCRTRISFLLSLTTCDMKRAKRVLFGRGHQSPEVVGILRRGSSANRLRKHGMIRGHLYQPRRPGLFRYARRCEPGGDTNKKAEAFRGHLHQSTAVPLLLFKRVPIPALSANAVQAISCPSNTRRAEDSDRFHCLMVVSRAQL